jgi:predicted DNA repair protein MutK
MAGSSLFTLIDDIATLLDDVAVMSKVAVQKTAGVLGDDLALNAQQVSGVNPDRELPVVWAVAKGSLKNKAILVPSALAISAFIPWAVIPLLMIGGAYLCYEGFEKIVHKLMHSREEAAEEEALHAKELQALADPSIDLVALEKEKIQGAIRTDFILSAEILVIALGTVATAPFVKQVSVMLAVAVVMTVGVYGLVAGIVKLDDVGLYLSKLQGASGLRKIKRSFGRFLLWGAPYLMKTLSIAGTIAMFLVGGSIIVHGVPALHHLSEHWASAATAVAGIGVVLGALTPFAVEGVVGIVAGALVLGAVLLLKRVFGRRPAAH